MILDIVLNPLIDKECLVENFEVSAQNRINDQTMEIGGEGMNCARVVKNLQGEPMVLGFFGGLNGRFIKSSLDKYKIKSHCIMVEGETHMRTTIIDSIKGTKTIIDEGSLSISEQDTFRFLEEVQGSIKDTKVVVIDGRLEEGIKGHPVEKVIEMAKNYNKKIIVASEDHLLRDVLKYQPYGIKLNKDNLKDLGFDMDEQLLENVHKLLLECGIHYIILDFGLDGLYTFSKNKVCFVEPLKHFEPISVNRAESAVLGAFAVAVERKYEQERFSKLLMASSYASMLYNEKNFICNKANVDLISNKLKVKEIMNRNKGWQV